MSATDFPLWLQWLIAIFSLLGASVALLGSWGLLRLKTYYERVHALKKEAVIKLGSIRPATIGQASRIPGITPADIALLLVHLQKRGRQQA